MALPNRKSFGTVKAQRAPGSSPRKLNIFAASLLPLRLCVSNANEVSEKKPETDARRPL
jgi:hypothetical protein